MLDDLLFEYINYDFDRIIKMSYVSLYEHSPEEKPIKAKFESEDFNYYHFSVLSTTRIGFINEVRYELKYCRNNISGIVEIVSDYTNDEKIMRLELFNEWGNIASYININDKLPSKLNTDYSICGKDEGYDYKYVRYHINQVIYFCYIPGDSIIIEVEHKDYYGYSYIEYIGNVDVRMFEDVVKIITSISRYANYPLDDYEFTRKDKFMSFLSRIRNN